MAGMRKKSSDLRLHFPRSDRQIQKRLIFDRRYGWVYDEWKDPAEEALAGGRGMFCVVPIAKGLLRMASQSMLSKLDSRCSLLVKEGETFGRIIKVEGARGLYLGLVPALTRSALYGGLRLGLYEPCKYLCDLMFGSTNIFVKIASGAFSGALATALTNPMEVLKVRLQMNSKRGLTREMHKIISEEGVRALWKGVGPAMTRAGALTASQLATYDESKQALLRWTRLEEGFHLHLISSCVAGTVGTLVTAPVDMIKTRLMLQQDSRGGRTYRNLFHCAYRVVLTEGVGALYKGGFATFARLGPQTSITFLVCEKLRELAGMDAM